MAFASVLQIGFFFYLIGTLIENSNRLEKERKAEEAKQQKVNEED